MTPQHPCWQGPENGGRTRAGELGCAALMLLALTLKRMLDNLSPQRESREWSDRNRRKRSRRRPNPEPQTKMPSRGHARHAASLRQTSRPR